MSEFYAEWLVCQAMLSKIQENKIAKKLLMAMNDRLAILKDTMQFKCALYFDPRFNYIGSNRLTVEDKANIQVK